MIISGTYNLKKDTLFRLGYGFPIQDNVLLCDTTTGTVTINLFEIAEVGRHWYFQVFIVDYLSNSAVNNIIINASGSDTINGNSSTSLTINSNGQTFAIEPVSETEWIAFTTGNISGGGVSDKNFVYTQGVASASWTVNHNLGKRCAVQVLDNAFNEVEAEIIWVDDDTVTVTFNNPQTGYVYCN